MPAERSAQAIADAVRHDLLGILRDGIVPKLRSSETRTMLYLKPPLAVPPHIRFETEPLLPLKVKREPLTHPWSYVSEAKWPEHGLHSLRFPYLGWLVEGEADLCLGTTEQMAREATLPPDLVARYTVSLPAHSFWFVPPGVPFSDGSVPHWNREHPEKAYSRIFWLRILPAGAYCHTCLSVGSNHIWRPSLFLRDAELHGLVRLLGEEMEKPDNPSTLLARSLLLVVMLRVEQAISGLKAHGTNIGEQDTAEIGLKREVSSHDAIIERACHYIRSHYEKPLSPALVARQVYTSTSQLVRLFRTELDITVMQYATKCRLEAASGLLQTTDLPIHEIARLSGYSNVSHFSVAFQKHYGATPTATRKGYRAGNNEH